VIDLKGIFREKSVDQIRIHELIISCESCGIVKKFQVNSQADCDRIFHNFRCENNCGRSLYSFIELGVIERKSAVIPLKMKHVASAE